MVEKVYSNIRIHAILFLATFILSTSLVAQGDEMDYTAIKTVVIDAGHGGKDPGCHGASAKEKHVCLSMALMLGDMITEKYPAINVVYTRDKDVFVELDERAKIANRNNADLFICIHANAASAKAHGTETYVLGLHRTESQQRVAARENAIIHLEADGGAKYDDFDLSPDAIIARQIQLSVFLDQSISFASKLQKEFTLIGRFDRGVKQAGFLVLYKTTMPSVLIETGFLTNPKEEKFLNTPKTQRQMANSMFTAFQKYKNELEGVEELIEDKPIVQPELKRQEDLTDTDVVFRVQIETSEKKIPLTSKKFKGYTVYEYQQNGIFKYTVGGFINDIEAARAYRLRMVGQGYQHAFVVGFLNQERINLQKAIKLAEK
ncbi:MAG: N-acetylmuramoyl-L-alanine amidase [Crocinitomicaceae bacterium]|nr:N-acetylmuramoyl-L-alanine amidase [Crocinitomicaceae bacterium]MDG1777559.1 N-acetylmuramoyl-L-alanine amidase [Crocinitomicaceae bacterium]